MKPEPGMKFASEFHFQQNLSSPPAVPFKEQKKKDILDIIKVIEHEIKIFHSTEKTYIGFLSWVSP